MGRISPDKVYQAASVLPVILLISVSLALLTTKMSWVSASSSQDKGHYVTLDGEKEGLVRIVNRDTCNACHTDVYIAVEDMSSLSCSSCHLGDPEAEDVSSAHKELITNPIDPAARSKTCGRCHDLREEDLQKFFFGVKRMHPRMGEVRGLAKGFSGCKTCHENITISIKPMERLSCISCHSGNGSSLSKELAHEGLIKNPIDPSVVYSTCGQCHSPDVYNLAIRIHPLQTQLKQTTTITFAEAVTSVKPVIDGEISKGEYPQVVDYGPLKVYWRIINDTIYVGLEGETYGWVAIGFSSKEGMADADIVLGWVEGGKAHVLDSYSQGKYGPHKSDLELGGRNDVLEYAGTESLNRTVIEFSRKLVTRDPYDKPLVGAVRVIWAIGGSDDPKSIHVARGNGTLNLKVGRVTRTASKTTLTTKKPALKTGKQVVSSETKSSKTGEVSTSVQPTMVQSSTAITTSTGGVKGVEPLTYLLEVLGLPLLIVLMIIVIAVWARRSPSPP